MGTSHVEQQRSSPPLSRGTTGMAGGHLQPLTVTVLDGCCWAAPNTSAFLSGDVLQDRKNQAYCCFHGLWPNGCSQRRPWPGVAPARCEWTWLSPPALQRTVHPKALVTQVRLLLSKLLVTLGTSWYRVAARGMCLGTSGTSQLGAWVGASSGVTWG